MSQEVDGSNTSLSAIELRVEPLVHPRRRSINLFRISSAALRAAVNVPDSLKGSSTTFSMRIGRRGRRRAVKRAEKDTWVGE